MTDYLQRLAGLVALLLLSSFLFSLFALPAVADDPLTGPHSMLAKAPAAPGVTLPAPTLPLPTSPITIPITTPPLTLPPTTLAMVTTTVPVPPTLPGVTTTTVRRTTTTTTTHPTSPTSTSTTTTTVAASPPTTAPSQAEDEAPAPTPKPETIAPAGDRSVDAQASPNTEATPPTASPDAGTSLESTVLPENAPSAPELDGLVTVPIPTSDVVVAEPAGTQLTFHIPDPAAGVFAWPLAMLEMLVESLQSSGRALLVPFSLAGAVGWWLGKGDSWPWEDRSGS